MPTGSTVEEALKLIERDPVRGYVAIAVLAARPPAKGIVVPVKGRSILLPDWTGAEWGWYARLAFRIADNLPATARGLDDKTKANKRLTPLSEEMHSLGAERPVPAKAFALYDAAVRLVIASAAGSDRETGKLATDAFREAFTEIPSTIGAVLASVLSGGGQVLIPAAKAAGEILQEVFEQAAKSLAIPIAIGIGLWLWHEHTKSRNQGEQ